MSFSVFLFFLAHSEKTEKTKKRKKKNATQTKSKTTRILCSLQENTVLLQLFFSIFLVKWKDEPNRSNPRVYHVACVMYNGECTIKVCFGCLCICLRLLCFIFGALLNFLGKRRAIRLLFFFYSSSCARALAHASDPRTDPKIFLLFF